MDPLEGADAIAEVTMVSQRLAGVPMENNGILAVPGDDGHDVLDLAPGAARAFMPSYAAMLGMEPGEAPGGLPMGRRRIRSEGGRIRRVHGRCRRRADSALRSNGPRHGPKTWSRSSTAATM